MSPEDGSRDRRGRHRGMRSARRNRLARELSELLERLPETQRAVVERRVGLADGHPHSQADTARALGLTRNEVREIEQRAFSRIRETIPLDQLQRLLPD